MPALGVTRRSIHRCCPAIARAGSSRAAAPLPRAGPRPRAAHVKSVSLPDYSVGDFWSRNPGGAVPRAIKGHREETKGCAERNPTRTSAYRAIFSTCAARTSLPVGRHLHQDLPNSTHAGYFAFEKNEIWLSKICRPC